MSRPSIWGPPFNCPRNRRCICDDVSKEFLWIRWGGPGVMGEFFVLFRNPLGSHNIRGMRFEKTL